MDASQTVSTRKGAIECVAQVVTQLEDKVIPFTVLFVVPVLRLMSDHDTAVRQMASFIFGNLVQCGFCAALGQFNSFGKIRKLYRYSA